VGPTFLEEVLKDIKGIEVTKEGVTPPSHGRSLLWILLFPPAQRERPNLNVLLSSTKNRRLLGEEVEVQHDLVLVVLPLGVAGGGRQGVDVLFSQSRQRRARDHWVKVQPYFEWHRTLGPKGL